MKSAAQSHVPSMPEWLRTQVFVSQERSQTEEEEGRPSGSARSFRGFEGERRMEEETGQSEGWTEGQELGQRVNTCRSQNQRLQEVRQRHNPSHHIFAVNQHQTMHLREKANRVQPPQVHRTDWARSSGCATSAFAIRSMMVSSVSWW